MDKAVFDFKDYIGFLAHRLEEKPGSWGLKKKLAEAIGCQPTYLSQALKGKADLSLEQLFKVCDFFNLTDEEKNFLILLQQKDRAGTKELEKYFQNQILEILNKRMSLTKRFGAKNDLTEVQQSTYYSSWLYKTIHFAVGLEEFQTREALKKSLNISFKKLDQILNFLLEIGLIQEENARYKTKVQSIRLGNESQWITRHHADWRMQAISSLESEDINDLHYSGVYTLANEDVRKIKDILLEAIKKNVDIVTPSKEEAIYTCTIDFFKTLK